MYKIKLPLTLKLHYFLPQTTIIHRLYFTILSVNYHIKPFYQINLPLTTISHHILHNTNYYHSARLNYQLPFNHTIYHISNYHLPSYQWGRPLTPHCWYHWCQSHRGSNSWSVWSPAAWWWSRSFSPPGIDPPRSEGSVGRVCHSHYCKTVNSNML